MGAFKLQPHQQEILDDPSLSDVVKRVMLRFWKRVHEIETTKGQSTPVEDSTKDGK
jgi:hypothetical protein